MEGSWQNTWEVQRRAIHLRDALSQGHLEDSQHRVVQTANYIIPNIFWFIKDMYAKLLSRKLNFAKVNIWMFPQVLSVARVMFRNNILNIFLSKIIIMTRLRKKKVYGFHVVKDCIEECIMKFSSFLLLFLFILSKPIPMTKWDWGYLLREGSGLEP